MSIMNKIRPSPPCFARSLPPRGSREAADNFCLIVRRHDEARGSREAADNFCLIVRKHDEARGSLGTRLTIFAEENEDYRIFFRQGESKKTAYLTIALRDYGKQVSYAS